MSQSWRDAAQRAKGQSQAGTDSKVTIAAIRELSAFMESDDGAAAKELLAATRRHINLGQTGSDGGYCVVYSLTAEGLVSSREASGMWMAYAKDIPKPKLSPISPAEAVSAAVLHGHMQPELLMTWLRLQLDLIANSIPA